MISEYPDFAVTAMPRPHSVQFYESDDFLCSVITEYVAEGVRAGEPAIVIATEAHNEMFALALRSEGIPLDRITFLDARQTLARFANGGAVDGEKFLTSVGAVIDDATQKTNRIRAYGEMVDLLWRDGYTEAAVKLEGLWNDLSELYPFRLLCAYSMNDFASSAHSARFDEVCFTHSHVMPAETFGDEPSGRDIAMLQQRAKALETEIAHRQRFESDNAFLLDVATTLIRSLEYDARLDQVARLAVPRLGDWCAIDVEREDGVIERASSAGKVDETLGSHKLVVPMTIGERSLGSVTFVRSTAYDYRDSALAAEYVRRAAMALENARLYHLAQHSNQMKDQFLATLSHELRTPLTAILGWARMLTVANLDPEMIRTACATIERSARTQATIIDDLLDLSKIVTGKLSLRSEPVDLMTVIDAALETLQLALESKSMQVDVTAPPERAIVNGDPTRLQQIVWNLLSNSIKFSPKGSHILVSLERRSDVARIVVRDQGKGIPAAFLPHVFDSFRQADAHITREHGGLGLGLAIVKYLAELHGGSVTASSAGEGAGATFVVTLPLIETMQSSSRAMADLRAITMLVLHEDRDTRELLAAIGRRAGARILCAESIDEAEAQIAANGIDVVASSGGQAPRLSRPVVHVEGPIDPIEFTYAIANVSASGSQNRSSASPSSSS